MISSGSYMYIGGILAHLATFMGYRVSLEPHGGPHLVADFAALQPGDCLIAISFWRLNKQVVLATEHARRRGIQTVAITDSAFSPLARAADLALVVPTESGSFFQSLTAPLSVVYAHRRPALRARRRACREDHRRDPEALRRARRPLLVRGGSP